MSEQTLELGVRKRQYLQFVVGAPARCGRREVPKLGRQRVPQNHPVPPGRFAFFTYSRHFVPGYHHAVPPGQGRPITNR